MSWIGKLHWRLALRQMGSAYAPAMMAPSSRRYRAKVVISVAVDVREEDVGSQQARPLVPNPA